MVVIDVSPYCTTDNYLQIESLACKIALVRDQQIVLDLWPEGFDIVSTGFENAVKNIADELNIPYENITFKTCDRLCNSKIFKAIPAVDYFLSNIISLDKFTAPAETNYGMFFGRVTNERLYSFWKHRNFYQNKKGIVNFHYQKTNFNEFNSSYTGFICEHNKKWQEIKDLLPYIDVPDHAVVDKDLNSNASGNAWQPSDFWNSVYKKITVEIVSETNLAENTFFITEKTYRPIAYGRLFLVIGNTNFERRLKDMGFDIFDDIIDKSYDTEYGYIRIDKIFNSLGKFLSENSNIDSLYERLKNNQKHLAKLSEMEKVKYVK